MGREGDVAEEVMGIVPLHPSYDTDPLNRPS